MRRHIPFLKHVFMHSITAFGGPQAHIGMMLKTFVEKNKFVTQEELMEYNAFCSILPGASSTQILALIAYKRGGVSLSVLTFMVWIFPACVLMCMLSFFLQYLNPEQSQKLFRFINPMAIGFLLYASVQAYMLIKKNTIIYYLIFCNAIIICIGFKFPWLFPLLLIISGCITNLSKKRIPENNYNKKKLRWTNIIYFVGIFVLAGFFSELARKDNWSSTIRKPINLFENTYRMGSTVFGGGQVLIPMMESQFCERFNSQRIKKRNPNAINIKKEDFYTGAGMVRAIPGPVFSIASFTGALALSDGSVSRQIFGSIIGAIGIFLPSALLIFFFFPLWANIKNYPVVYRALEGINASVVGIMLGSAIFMLKDSLVFDYQELIIINMITILLTFILLQFTKLPAPIVVLISLILGLVV